MTKEDWSPMGDVLDNNLYGDINTFNDLDGSINNNDYTIT
jgi:hypothetical protein